MLNIKKALCKTQLTSLFTAIGLMTLSVCHEGVSVFLKLSFGLNIVHCPLRSTFLAECGTNKIPNASSI